MTATPIPRTLALLGYGDLDVTTLRELPRGRRPIDDARRLGRARARAGLRAHPRGAARRAPGVRRLPARRGVRGAAGARGDRRVRAPAHATEFRDFRVVLLHGQMRPREKAEAMARFAAGEADVLVATTVIEVGIDVPNATVMLVEDAERYGISQLHQLRGRIGRGEHASVCLLFGPKESARLRGARRAPRRLPPGRDRPRAARRGRAHRHAPVGPGRLPLRPAARRRRRCWTARARVAPRPAGDATPSWPRPSTCCSPTRCDAAHGAARTAGHPGVSAPCA